MPYATESKFGRKMFYFQNRVLYESSIIRSGYLDPLNSRSLAGMETESIEVM